MFCFCVVLEVGTNWEVYVDVKNAYYIFVVQLVFSQKMLTVKRNKCQGEFVILVIVILLKIRPVAERGALS